MTQHILISAAAGIMGFIAGFLLVKGGFDLPGKIRKMLQLKDRDGLSCLVWMMISAAAVNCIFFYLDITKFDIPERGFWPSLIGGMTAGTGLMLWGMTPVSAASALGRGRISVLFAAAGMLLAFPAAEILRKWAPDAFQTNAGKVETPAYAENFFAVDNPVIWVIAASAAVLCVLNFAAGKND